MNLFEMYTGSLLSFNSYGSEHRAKMAASFKVTNNNGIQTACELEVWPPPQGTSATSFPLEADLRFDIDYFDFAGFRVSVTLSRAELTLTTNGIRVTRGSRIGDSVHEPYEAREICESIERERMNEHERGAQLEAEISQIPFFRTLLSFRKSRRERNSVRADSSMRVTSKGRRVQCLPNNRWQIVEPVPPKFLSGKYLGSSFAESADRQLPVCLLEAGKGSTYLTLTVTCLSEDIHFRFERIDNVQSQLSNDARNKEIILGILAKRSAQVTPSTGLAGLLSGTFGKHVLSISRMEIVDDTE